MNVSKFKSCHSHNMACLCILITAIPSHAQFGNSGLVNTNAVRALQLLVQRADEAFEKQEYKEAFELYQTLAKDAGDQFSQYRLARMYDLGLHVERDIIEAYGWATLSAESSIETFSEYRNGLQERLNDTQFEPALDRAKQLISQYGIYQQAYESRQMLRNQKFRCTGSRVGNTCASVSTSSYDCGIGADRPPSKKCLRMGRLGLNAVAGSMPLKVKQAEQKLEGLMRQYAPGTVTLGELELLDDETRKADEKEPKSANDLNDGNRK